MTSRDFSDYPNQEGDDMSHRHPGRVPVSMEERGRGEKERKADIVYKLIVCFNSISFPLLPSLTVLTYSRDR